MNFVFLVDQYDKWNIDKDTSFALMVESNKRGHRICLLHEGGIYRIGGKTHFSLTSVVPQSVEERPFKDEVPLILNEDEIDIVFIRTDPPFDYDYLMQTWLLDLLPKTIPVINNPTGIRTVNEKIWATQFTSLIPPTFVGRNKVEMIDFISEQGTVVIKPNDGFGGGGILQIAKEDDGVTEKISSVTENFTKDAILQKFIPEADKGDKRIILLNGEILGAVLRVHREDDFLNNFMAGGTPHETTITDKDQRIVDALKPHLQKLGLYFVGIDIIDEYLIEVNVTSPTCLQEINQIYGLRLEEQVIDFAENLIDRRKSQAKMSV